MMIYIVEGGAREGQGYDGPGVGHTPGVTRACEGCHVAREDSLGHRIHPLEGELLAVGRLLQALLVVHTAAHLQRF